MRKGERKEQTLKQFDNLRGMRTAFERGKEIERKETEKKRRKRKRKREQGEMRNKE